MGGVRIIADWRVRRRSSRMHRVYIGVARGRRVVARDESRARVRPGNSRGARALGQVYWVTGSMRARESLPPLCRSAYNRGARLARRATTTTTTAAAATALLLSPASFYNCRDLVAAAADASF